LIEISIEEKYEDKKQGINNARRSCHPKSVFSQTTSVEPMELVRNTNLSALLVLLSCFCLQFGSATDTITVAKFINDSETIISNGVTSNWDFSALQILPIGMLGYGMLKVLC
jgi:hypothetical protein